MSRWHTTVLLIYRDRKGEWRWRLKAPNGRVIGDSSEGYKLKSGARAAAARAQMYMGWAMLKEKK